MGYLIFIILIALIFAVSLSFIKNGRYILHAKLLRLLIVLISAGVFAFWFFQSSTVQFKKDAMVLQVVNGLPQPIDFYVMKVNKVPDGNGKYVLKHLGNIRTEHFRIEYLDMSNSDEYWIMGYLGKKNMVYFSQHSVPNKNMDQIVEVHNYINQSMKLSAMGADEVQKLKSANINTAIQATLALLLLFLNTILLVRKR